MKLHSPPFEKALRCRVKQAVRDSPELKRERRAARKIRNRYRVVLVAQTGLFAVLALLVWLTQLDTGHPVTTLAVITLWGFGLIILRAQALLMTLFASSDIHALILLPIPEPEIFEWQLQKFLRGSFVFLLHFFAGFSVLAWTLNFSPARWIAVPFLAVLSWAVMISASVHCAARLPRLPYRILSGGIVVVLFGIILGREYVGPVLLKLLDHSASTLNFLLPTGWPVSLFSLLLPNPNWIYLILLIPIAALLWPVKSSLTSLAGLYDYNERIVPPASDLVPHTEPTTAIPPVSEQPFRLGPTAVEEVIRSRQFLLPFPWHNAGWLENLLWRWLSPREKALSDFVFPSGLVISKQWKILFRNLTISLALAFAAGLTISSAKLWLLGIGLFIIVCHALALLLMTGRAFQLGLNSGVGIPMYAGLGIGLRELATLLLKCSAVQIPLLLLFTTVWSTVLVYVRGYPLPFGLWFGAKAGVLLFAGRFIALTFGFSGGTNDTSGFRFRTVGLVLSMVCLVLLFAGLAVASLFIPNQLRAAILLLLAIADACAVFGVYGWFYNANRFDLMRLPQR